MFGNTDKGKQLGRNKTPTKPAPKPLIGSAPNPNLKVGPKINTGSKGKIGDLVTHSGKKSVSPQPSGSKSAAKSESPGKTESGIGFKVPDYVSFWLLRSSRRKFKASLWGETES